MPEERKLVTLLFADVTDSTVLAERLDSEDVRALLARYYDHARRIIDDCGGTIEKFIGDAVMAVFGLVQSHGDDAERALSAALFLREAVAQDSTLCDMFTLRMGVNSGEVITSSNPAAGDFLVTGDVVNSAARLQQSAEPDEILVSERTMYATQTAFLFEHERTITVKGKRQPLRVATLKGKRSMRQSERPLFVGRRSDLLQLSLLQARTLEEEYPHIATIIAPAGTGKTRLLEEFISRIDPADGFRIVTVRCQPYGQTFAYRPLRVLLGQDTGATMQLQQVMLIFAHAGYKADDAQRLSELILSSLLQYRHIERNEKVVPASSIGVASEGEDRVQKDMVSTEAGCEGESGADRESIMVAWRRLVEALCLSQRTPQLLVFEDLHWASDSLLDLVEQLMHIRMPVALFIVVLSRPELLDRRPAWGGGRQNAITFSLRPLKNAQVRQLVTQQASELPEAVREQIVERAGGNPFFALELVRGLREAHAIPQQLPDTIHAAILARLDQLGALERYMLQIAAVINRRVTPTLLTQLMDGFSRQDVERICDNLLARDLIAPVAGDSFVLRHQLIRDVAYNLLARSERIRLHSQVALALERSIDEHSDEYTAVIAYHYYEAIQYMQQSTVQTAAPIDRAKALFYLRRAGVLASQTGAFAEARTCLEAALMVAPEADQISLYEQLGDSCWWSKTSVEYYERALAAWRNTCVEQPLIGARLLRKALICYTRGGVYELLGAEGLAAWQAEAWWLVKQVNDEAERWHLHVADMFVLLRNIPIDPVKVSDSLLIGKGAIRYFEKKQDWGAFSEALDGYGALASCVGQYDEALRAARRRLTIPELSASEYGDALHMVVQYMTNLDEYDQALAVMDQALAQLRPDQSLIPIGVALSNSMMLAFDIGAWDTLGRWFSTLEEVREQIDYDPGMGFVIFNGYLMAFLMARARDDQKRMDYLKDVMVQFSLIATNFEAELDCLLQAVEADDPRQIEPYYSSHDCSMVFLVMKLYNEYGLVLPPEIYAQVKKLPWRVAVFPLYCEGAEALQANDDVRLARVIDALEEHQQIVCAARMRIVLAQRTNDASQLERVRSVLMHLGDQLFLRRLEAVATTLSSSSRG